MKMQELARWIRDEHERVQELASRMQELVAVVPRSNQEKWIITVTDFFDHLRAHCIKHMALEGQGGYMLPVVERRPALSKEVDQLAHEHTEITRIMDGIHDALHELKPDDALLIRDCCRRVQDCLSYIEHHENTENLLVMSAFTDDIGTKD